MNLYLLLALAFGTITVQAPVVRKAPASVVMRREVRAECGRPARIRRTSRPATIALGRDARPLRTRRPHANPSSPRAPAPSL
jgi:hypothetical protein